MAGQESGFRIYRGKLPHWRMQGATYFVTWRIKPGIPDLDPRERQVVSTALAKFHGTKYRLHAYVVMNDHVHILLTPSLDLTLERIVRAWKSYTSRVLKESRGSDGLWQREYFDRIIRNHGEFMEKGEYILHNPWKRWPELKEYPWMGVETGDAAGGSGDPPPLSSVPPLIHP